MRTQCYHVITGGPVPPPADRCQTGKSRIKGMLPEGTDVAHKTGSVGGVVNDVGILTLPGNAGTPIARLES